MSSTKNDDNVVQSVDRALSIVETLARENRSLALSELSDRLELHPSTAHRLLASLASRGYVFKDPDTKKYGLGLKILEISQGLDLVSNLRAVGRDVLRQLAKAAGETVNLMVLERGEALIVDRFESDHMLKYSVPIGTRLPLHCTASGKALLANMRPPDVEEFMKRELPALTPNTIVDRYQLLKELEHIRNRGYAIDNEERELGVRCVAAPVSGDSGQCIGVVSISGPTSRMTPQRLGELADLVTESADVMGSALGSGPATEPLHSGSIDPKSTVE